MTGPKILIMGPPGAGKTTLSKKISEHYDIPHIETGALLRSKKQVETEDGNLGELIDMGKRPPDSIVDDMIRKRINNLEAFVLDGYPRSKSQAKMLDEISEIDVIFYLSVSEEVVVERLAQRQRPDDQPESARTRIRSYRNRTVPLLDFYRERGLLMEVDGEQEVENVIQDIMSELSKIGYSR